MKKNLQNPNPSGKTGKPITLAPMTFEDAVKKMLGTQPPKDEPKEATKRAAKKAAKK